MQGETVNTAEEQRPAEAAAQPPQETQEEAFDEPDDELEEFDEIGTYECLI